MAEYMKAYSSQTDDYLRVHRAFVYKVLGFSEGQRGILTNGRVSLFCYHKGLKQFRHGSDLCFVICFWCLKGSENKENREKSKDILSYSRSIYRALDKRSI